MSQMLQIHGQLREMILSLDLGPGERLTERWLESRFAGSRTPIRAALARLEGEEYAQLRRALDQIAGEDTMPF